MIKKLFAGLAILALLAPAAAFAQAPARTNATSSAGQKPAKPAKPTDADRMANAKARADQEIARRVDSLNKELDRIKGMKRVSDDFKSTLESTFQSQIQSLNDLKAKIDAETSSSTLKDEMGEIAKSYRIFALVLPQSAIAAAADRVQTIVDLMNQLADKVSATSTSLLLVDTMQDFRGKIADAQTQAINAVNAIKDLKPDNGDAATMSANKAALQSARAAIQKATQDLQTARQEIDALVKDAKAKRTPSSAASAPVVEQ